MSVKREKRWDLKRDHSLKLSGLKESPFQAEWNPRPYTLCFLPKRSLGPPEGLWPMAPLEVVVAIGLTHEGSQAPKRRRSKQDSVFLSRRPLPCPLPFPLSTGSPTAMLGAAVNFHLNGSSAIMTTKSRSPNADAACRNFLRSARNSWAFVCRPSWNPSRQWPKHFLGSPSPTLPSLSHWRIQEQRTQLRLVEEAEAQARGAGGHLAEGEG